MHYPRRKDAQWRACGCAHGVGAASELHINPALNSASGLASVHSRFGVLLWNLCALSGDHM